MKNCLRKKPRSITIELIRTDQTPLKKTFALNFPTSNHQHLWNLLKHQIDNLHLGHGIEIVTLFTNHSALISTAQLDQFSSDGFSSQTADETLGSLLDTLQQYLGPHAINYLTCKESHIPENSFSFSTTPQQNTVPLTTNTRPSILLPCPIPIKTIALLPDHPPSQLIWNNKRYRITNRCGPERITPEWWVALNQEQRDYFKIQLPSGTWLWIFRSEEQWFIHGIWA